MEVKALLSILAILISFAGCCIYFRQIFWGNVRPHAFSWLIWFVLVSVAFAAQVAGGAGVGAWVLGFSSVATLFFFLVALAKGDRHFVSADWLFLLAAVAALLLWWLTKDPTLSVVLITLTDAAGASLTIRKAYQKPQEESMTHFGLASFKSAISLFALESFSLATWLYPASLVISNGLVVFTLLMRRKKSPRT
ncbi:MAG: hypothetical protein EXS51_01840 [Candidatus Taylorbacteria bacterium]|nr:hypothetical protein [Candidatus Taylorbacteria bacterium]